jgi:hypothetical protein
MISGPLCSVSNVRLETVFRHEAQTNCARHGAVIAVLIIALIAATLVYLYSHTVIKVTEPCRRDCTGETVCPPPYGHEIEQSQTASAKPRYQSW